jgi:hypothetical protein
MEALAGRGGVAPTLFLTSAPEGMTGSITLWFTAGERDPATYCAGGWVGLTASLDAEITGKKPLLSSGIKLWSSSPQSDIILTDLPGSWKNLYRRLLSGTRPKASSSSELQKSVY